MSQIKLLIGLALLAGMTVLVMFGAQTSVIFIGMEIPLVMIVVGSLFIGALMAAVLGIAENLKLKKEARGRKKETKALEEKIKELQLKIREIEDKAEQEVLRKELQE